MAKAKKNDATREGTESITVVATQASGRWACHGKFHFTTEAQTVDVTEEEYDEIEADPVLTIVPDKPAAPAAAET